MRIARMGNRLLIAVHEATLDYAVGAAFDHDAFDDEWLSSDGGGPGHNVFFHSCYRLLLMFLTIFTSTITAFLRLVQFLIGGTLGSSLSDPYLSLSKT